MPQGDNKRKPAAATRAAAKASLDPLDSFGCEQHDHLPTVKMRRNTHCQNAQKRCRPKNSSFAIASLQRDLLRQPTKQSKHTTVMCSPNMTPKPIISTPCCNCSACTHASALARGSVLAAHNRGAYTTAQHQQYNCFTSPQYRSEKTDPTQHCPLHQTRSTRSV